MVVFLSFCGLLKKKEQNRHFCGGIALTKRKVRQNLRVVLQYTGEADLSELLWLGASCFMCIPIPYVQVAI